MFSPARNVPRTEENQRIRDEGEETVVRSKYLFLYILRYSVPKESGPLCQLVMDEPPSNGAMVLGWQDGYTHAMNVCSYFHG